MSTPESSNPVYSRTTPAQWERLLAFTQSQVNNGQTDPVPTTANVHEVLGELSSLEDEALEENRYYGLGLVMCGVARALQQPKVRADTIQWAARNVFDNPFSQRDPSDPFPLEEVSSHSMHYPFLRLTGEAASNMPPATLLLTDCLNAAANDRKWIIKHGSLPSDDHGEWRYKRILNGSLTADTIALNATAATLSTLQRAVDLVRSTPGTKEYIFGLEGDLEIIRAQSWRNVLVNFAALRLDEFRGDEFDTKSEFMDVTPDGTVIFRKDKKPAELAPPKQPEKDEFDSRALLHAKRLKCPALHVSGLLRIVEDIVPDIIEAAEDMRKQKVAENERYRQSRENTQYFSESFLHRSRKSATMKHYGTLKRD